MNSRTLTLATLKKKGACSEQVALFCKLFGKSVEITEALCAEHAEAFSWEWAAVNLLTAAKCAEYRLVTAAAGVEYRRVVAPAWAEYQRVTAAARAECDPVVAAASVEYRRVVAPAWAEYQRVTAAAWARAYISDKRECGGMSDHIPGPGKMVSARDVVARAMLDSISLSGTSAAQGEDNADAILSALAAAGYAVEQDWQPIETAPMDGTPVMIGCSRTQSQRWAVWSGGMWRDGQDFAGGRISGVPSPTHWRPLPAPPVAAKETQA